MEESDLTDDKQRTVAVIERLLGTKGELGFLLELPAADLERLLVAIRGRLYR